MVFCNPRYRPAKLLFLEHMLIVNNFKVIYLFHIHLLVRALNTFNVNASGRESNKFKIFLFIYLLIIKCFRQGKYMACCLLYRGDVVPKAMKQSIVSLYNFNFFSSKKLSLVALLQLFRMCSKFIV